MDFQQFREDKILSCVCPLCNGEMFRRVGRICIYCHNGLWKELEAFLDRQGFDIESSDEYEIRTNFLKAEITFRIWKDRLILRSKKNGWRHLLLIFPAFSKLERWAKERYLTLMVEGETSWKPSKGQKVSQT